MKNFKRSMGEIDACLDYCKATGNEWAFIRAETLKDIREGLGIQTRHYGVWVEYPECLRYGGAISKDHIACSICGHVWSILDNDTETFEYCPNCGACMVGQEREKQ